MCLVQKFSLGQREPPMDEMQLHRSGDSYDEESSGDETPVTPTFVDIDGEGDLIIDFVLTNIKVRVSRTSLTSCSHIWADTLSHYHDQPSYIDLPSVETPAVLPIEADEQDADAIIMLLYLMCEKGQFVFVPVRSGDTKVNPQDDITGAAGDVPITHFERANDVKPVPAPPPTINKDTDEVCAGFELCFCYDAGLNPLRSTVITYDTFATLSAVIGRYAAHDIPQISALLEHYSTPNIQRTKKLDLSLLALCYHLNEEHCFAELSEWILRTHSSSIMKYHGMLAVQTLPGSRTGRTVLELLSSHRALAFHDLHAALRMCLATPSGGPWLCDDAPNAPALIEKLRRVIILDEYLWGLESSLVAHLQKFRDAVAHAYLAERDQKPPAPAPLRPTTGDSGAEGEKKSALPEIYCYDTDSKRIPFATRLLKFNTWIKATERPRLCLHCVRQGTSHVARNPCGGRKGIIWHDPNKLFHPSFEQVQEGVSAYELHRQEYIAERHRNSEIIAEEAEREKQMWRTDGKRDAGGKKSIWARLGVDRKKVDVEAAGAGVLQESNVLHRGSESVVIGPGWRKGSVSVE